MSTNTLQNFTLKRFRLVWFVFILFYIFICFASWLYAVNFNKMGKAKIQQIRAEQIRKSLSVKNIKDSQPDIYNESLYNQGGGINPGFKNMVSGKANNTAEPAARAYEQQLAEYRLKLAQERQKQLEQERIQEEAIAKQRALIEQERQERLRQQQEMQKANAALANSKTVSTPKNPSEQKVNTTQQKTQIGTLKTSRFGESSIEKNMQSQQRF